MQQQSEHRPRYVPWKDGAELLEMSRGSFFYLVKTGQIAPEPGRAPRDGRYSLDDIEAIQARRQAGSTRKIYSPHKKRPMPVDLEWLAPHDIPAILRLDQIVYDEIDLASAQRYMEWSEKNPMLAMCAFQRGSNRQTMLAYVAALPLDESVILQIMRQEREETSITMDEIQSYARPGAYTLLANSAVCLPEHPTLLYRVIDRMVEAWIERFPERYVTRIYAQAWSERGDLLISHFFMSPRYDLAPNAFMLDLARPGTAKMIQRFQRALKAKALLPNELQYPVDVPAIEQPHPPKQTVQHSEPRREASTAQEGIIWLTTELAAFRSFSEVHGVPKTTARRTIDTGEVKVVSGEWRITGRKPYTEALDAAGRAAFYQKFHTYPNFTPCPDCPHT